MEISINRFIAKTTKKLNNKTFEYKYFFSTIMDGSVYIIFRNCTENLSRPF